MPFLSYKKNGRTVECRLGTDTTTIGRSRECTIRIANDTEVSRFHCSIEAYSDGTCRVMDTASKNGTYVNGKRIFNEELKLTPGDIIRVGITKLNFTDKSRYDTSAAFEEAAQDLERGKSVNDILKEIVTEREARGGNTTETKSPGAASHPGQKNQS